MGSAKSAGRASGYRALFVGRERLYGLGCGLVDMVLLASTLITPGAQLWTLNKRLRAMAERFRIAFQASEY